MASMIYVALFLVALMVKVGTGLPVNWALVAIPFFAGLADIGLTYLLVVRPRKAQEAEREEDVKAMMAKADDLLRLIKTPRQEADEQRPTAPRPRPVPREQLADVHGKGLGTSPSGPEGFEEAPTGMFLTPPRNPRS